jgi:hypothetical protein
VNEDKVKLWIKVQNSWKFSKKRTKITKKSHKTNSKFAKLKQFQTQKATKNDAFESKT